VLSVVDEAVGRTLRTEGAERVMTRIRMLPVHEIVQRTYPRPPREQDEVAKAVGKAIDGALSRFSYEFRQGRRPTATAMQALAEELLDEELEGAAAEVSSADREKLLKQVSGVLQAFRRSELFGLPRPRTRIILIQSEVGVYAQPDYWDGRSRFFEMKSYRAIPPPPDVELQLRLFQLAYPRFESFLVCFNRHSDPVETTSLLFPPPTEAEIAQTLRLAYELGRQHGEEKVLEYLNEPTLHYPLPVASPNTLAAAPSGDERP
jgi:hypothetical protein